MSGGRAASAYPEGRLKRAFDVTAALAGLIVLAPLLALLALLVVATMGSPAFFVQERVGRGGAPFRLVKFRTMRPDGGQGPGLTARGDARVTPLGRVLRRTKCDELPQLWNVLRGDMSIVGPRPELPRYVALYDARQRRVLRARPGLTDPASIAFRDEESRLAAAPEDRRERLYVEQILPEKLRLNLEYLEGAGFLSDLGLIARTAAAVARLKRG
jgi:lipopolysaccharide/colanic/teichoic acid biosynthesis glycosyltransferase